jgi:hypothetical protein
MSTGERSLLAVKNWYTPWQVAAEQQTRKAYFLEYFKLK